MTRLRGTGTGSDGLATLRGLNHWFLRAFKEGGADLWHRATTVLLQGPGQAVWLSLDEEREVVPPTSSQEGWFTSQRTA